MLILLTLVSGFLPASAAPTRQATPGTPTVDHTDKIIADMGFRPTKDGFGFPNYSNRQNPTNLTPEDMRALFGDRVCVQLEGGECTLDAVAQEEMERFNQIMNAGHCDGMATLALLLYRQTIHPERYGAANANGLQFAGNDLLQREIARWFATQIVNPTYAVKLRYVNEKITPATVLDKLIGAMNDKSEYYVIQFFQRQYKNGHAVTPYAVADMGNGIYHVLIYDNNYPNVERYIEIDKTANTWKYNAAINPSVKESLYEGDATTGTLMLVPLSLRLEPQECEFCAQLTGLVAPTATPLMTATTTPKTQFNEVVLTTSSTEDQLSLLIEDAQGHRLGYENGIFYNEIPGAYFVPLTSDSPQDEDQDEDNMWRNDPEPLYYVPAGVAFTILIDGRGMDAEDDEVASVSVFGRGYDVVIDEIDVTPGTVDEINFSADGRTVTYKDATGESPEIIFGIVQSTADYSFILDGATLDAGGSLVATLDVPHGQLDVTTKDTKTVSELALTVHRTDDHTRAEFFDDLIELDPGWSIYMDWGKWNGRGDLELEIDKDGDHQIDQTKMEHNKPHPGGIAYVQAAASGTFIHQKDKHYTLTLVEPSPLTNFINANAPYAVAPLSTEKLAKQWAAGNAKAITKAVLELDRVNVNLELSEPRYDAVAHTLTYEAEVLSVAPVGSAAGELKPPGAFGVSNLLIVENATLLEALTMGNKSLNDLVAGSGNNPDLNAGGANNPDLNAGGGNNPDLNAGTVAGEYPYVFHQTARGGSLVKSGIGYTLTLTSAYPLLQVVAQAPKPGVVWVSSDALHKVWNTFNTIKATALLSVNGKRVLLRLNHPVSEPTKGTIVYQAEILDGQPIETFQNADLLIIGDAAYMAALTFNLNSLQVTLNAGGGNNPDLNAGSGNNPDLNAGSGNNPDLNAGSGNNPDLNAGGVNLVIGTGKRVTPETAKVCQAALSGIADALKTLGGKIPDEPTALKLNDLNEQATAACPLASELFTPEARQLGNGITVIAFPPLR